MHAKFQLNWCCYPNFEYILKPLWSGHWTPLKAPPRTMLFTFRTRYFMKSGSL